MPVRRGTVYRFSRVGVATAAFLVLTNDDWNECMLDVAVAPLQPLDPASVPFPDPVIMLDRPLRVIAGRPLNWRKDELGASLYVLDEDRMSLVEDTLVDVLALEDLCASPPRQPSSPPGAISYPRWSEIYYAGEPIDNQRKRHVVVSSDHWNRETKTAVVVRTTPQERRGGMFFPAIQGGRARACCGNLTTFPAAALDLRHHHRPDPHRLSLQDMAAVAEGLVDALALEGALRRRAL